MGPAEWGGSLGGGGGGWMGGVRVHQSIGSCH